MSDPPPVPNSNAEFTAALANAGYEIERELKPSGLGLVFLARNGLMDRLEVLKVLADDMEDNHEARERFLREVRSSAKLKHPTIVTSYNMLRIDGHDVFAMEFVPGVDLNETIRQRLKTKYPLTIREACRIAFQIAEGLQHAFEKGMVHRDIKPSNVMIYTLDGEAKAKILNFGFARYFSEKKSDELPRADKILGTPEYMAPERFVDTGGADIREDIYSLGCTLFHMLAGQPPFQGTQEEILAGHLRRSLPRLLELRAGLPLELVTVIEKMTAKDPTARYQTPKMVGDALRPFCENRFSEKPFQGGNVDGVPPAIVSLSGPKRPTEVGETSPSTGTASKNLLRKTTPSKTAAKELVEKKFTNWDRNLRKTIIWVCGATVLFAVIFGILTSLRPRRDLTRLNSSNDPTLTASIPVREGSSGAVVNQPANNATSAFEKSLDRITLDSTMGPKPSQPIVESPTDKSIQSEAALAVSRTPESQPTMRIEPKSIERDTWESLPTNQPIDLMPFIKFPEHVVAGQWRRDEKFITCEASNRARFVVPVAIDGDYDVILVFVRKKGVDDLKLVLPHANTSFNIAVDAFQGSLSGLAEINNLGLGSMRDKKIFTNAWEPLGTLGSLNKLHRLSVRVSVATKRPLELSVSASLDETEIVQWRGWVGNLQSPSHSMMPNISLIGLESHLCMVEIRDLQLKLGDEGKGIYLPEDWSNGLNQVAAKPDGRVLPQCAKWGDKHYFVSDKPMALNEAYRQAARIGGRLLTISSAEESKFVKTIVGDKKVWTAAWRSGSDADSKSGWRDERNRPLRYFGLCNEASFASRASADSRIVVSSEIDESEWIACDWSDSRIPIHACIEWGEEYPAEQQ